MIEDPAASSARLSVPAHLMEEPSAEHFVLRVVGESLNEEGIVDGDYVIALRTDRPRVGDLVLCTIGSDATIKRYWPEGDSVRLEPANGAPSISARTEEVRVSGVVVGLMRKYPRGPW